MDNSSGGGTPTQPVPVAVPPPTGEPWGGDIPVPQGGRTVESVPGVSYAPYPLPAERPLRNPLVWSTGAGAAVTVVTAIWRLI